MIHLSWLAKIKDKWFQKQEEQMEEINIEQPEQSMEDEIVQGSQYIDLHEQVKIIRAVDQYMKEFIFPKHIIQKGWAKGFYLKNEIFIRQSDDPILRCNMEVFYQEPATAERKLDFLVSAVKFTGDDWRVFQVKEVLQTSK